MACIYINKKSIEWKNFQAKCGSEKEAVAKYVINGNMIPDNIEKPVTERLRYEGLVNVKRQSLEFIQSKIVSLEYQKKNADRDQAIEIQKDINIYKGLEAREISAIDALSSAELKAQALPSIKQYAEQDLSMIKEMISGDAISMDQIQYAFQVLKVWQNAGDFSGEHPYMSKEELALVGKTDEANIYDEYVGYFTKWKQEADLMNNRLLEVARELTSKYINNTLKFSGEIDYEEAVRIGSPSKLTLGITEVNSPLVQALPATLARAEFETKKEADVVFKEIGRLMSNLRKKGKEKTFVDLIKQKDEKGRATRNLVDWTSAKFTKIKSKLSKEYNKKLNSIDASSDANKDGQRREAENTYYSSLKEIEDGINPELLFSKDEAIVEKYKAELKNLLGSEIAEVLIKDSEKKLKQYEIDRADYEDSIKDESDLNISDMMKTWDDRYSPYNVYNKRFSKKLFSGGISNISNRYITVFPKTKVKTPTGDIVDSNFYDNNFKAIVQDKEFNEAYTFIIDTLQKLNSIVPSSKADFLDSKTLPDIEKSFIEAAFTDGVGSTVASIFDRMKETIRTSNIATTLDDTKLMPDGTIRKELQYNFVGNKRKEIGDYISLKTIQYNQKYGTNPPVELVDEWTADKNAELANDMSWDLEKVIKAYSLSAIGYKNKAKVEGMMRMVQSHIQKTVTADVNKAGEKLKTKDGKIFVDKGEANLMDLVNDYIDYFFGYNTKKEEGILGKVYTSDEKVTKAEIEEAIQKNIDDYATNKELVDEELKTAKGSKKKELEDKLENLTTDFTDVNEKLYKQLDNLGGNKVMSRGVDLFLKANQILRLGYNMVAPINNYVVGHLGLMIEASDGRRFNTKQLLDSMKITSGAVTHSATFGFLDTDNANKVRNLMHKYGVLKDSKNEVYTFNHYTTGILDTLGPHNLSTRTEYMNQSNTMVPMLLNTKVTLVDGTVTNAWEASDKEGNLPEGAVISDDWGTIDETILKGKIDAAVRAIHGNYDPDAKLPYKNTIVGRVLGQFRSWAFMGFHERFGKEQRDNLARLDKKGRYRSYGALFEAQEFKALWTITYQLLRKAGSAPLVNKLTGIEGTTFDQIEGLSAVDVANLKKNMTELAIILILAGAALLLQALFMDDDDEDSLIARAAIMALVNTIDRTSTDLLFYSSPAAFQELNKSIIPAASLLKDVGTLGTRIATVAFGGDDEIESGKYAGESGIGMGLIKVTPITNQILRVKNFTSEELNP